MLKKFARHNKIEKLDTVMDALFSSMGISEKLAEAKILNNWEHIVGRNIAQLTVKIDIYNRTLFVYTSSAAVKTELSMLKGYIVKNANSFAKKNVIDEVVVR
jgi:predicted nucleic acid-binding Zn ribbon protein